MAKNPQINGLLYAADDLPPLKGVERIYCWYHLRKKKHSISKKMARLSNKRYGHRANITRHAIFARFNIRIGKYSYGFEPLCHYRSTLAAMGAFCSIGMNVNISAGNHPTDSVTTHPIFFMKEFGLTDLSIPVAELAPKNEPVVIGHDVWVGRDVTILTGVTIGTGAVIAAGAVVTKDVPSYAIVGGVPAKIIRYRFDEKTIATLLASQWWLWPDEQLKAYLPHFFNPVDFIQNLKS